MLGTHGPLVGIPSLLSFSRTQVLGQLFRGKSARGVVVMLSRQIFLITLLLLLFVVMAWWLWSRIVRVAAPPSPAGVGANAPAGTPLKSSETQATGRPAPGQPAPAGYRLAGVALGEPESFAVVEAPNGTTGLYRLQDSISGLGELVRIEAERVVVRGDHEQFELWLAAAATATPAPTQAPQAATPMPPRRSRAGGTTRAPDTSAAPDRPAS